MVATPQKHLLSARLKLISELWDAGIKVKSGCGLGAGRSQGESLSEVLAQPDSTGWLCSIRVCVRSRDLRALKATSGCRNNEISVEL